ncbi:MAG: glycosyltransferase, partial [Planctomycetota bacterium]
MAFEHPDEKFGPLVSVLIPSYNRPEYLHTAITSVLRQDYPNIEVLVIRDGGDRIDSITKSFEDDRVILIDRDENRGIAYTLNEGLARARGKYVCYLGNDDLYYSHHVSRLVGALESETDCGVAYSDLYRTYCRIEQDGSREILSKVVEVSRDFDRFVMLYFNHALHVSLMHRRDLVERIGPYNEDLNVLIDWDLTRRLCFFTDFYHVNDITGEYYSPVGESDRVSVQRRKNVNEYLRNVLAIRTTRPAKPWPMVEDLSIIVVCEKLTQETAGMLGSIWRYTFYPYEVYLPLTRADSSRLDVGMPNVIAVEVGDGSTVVERVDAALARSKAEFVAVVPDGFPIREFWLEDSLYALINSSEAGEGFEFEDSTDNLWAVVLKTDDL